MTREIEFDESAWSEGVGPYLVSFVTSHGANGDALTRDQAIALRDWLTEVITASPTDEVPE